MKFLLFADVVLFLANLRYLLIEGYTDLNFVALCFTFVALLMAMYSIIESNIYENY